MARDCRNGAASAALSYGWGDLKSCGAPIPQRASKCCDHCSGRESLNLAGRQRKGLQKVKIGPSWGVFRVIGVA
jgi:hypothetical protein